MSIGIWARSERGFTFIEILMVVAILGIFVAMAAPRFRSTYLDLQLSNQARNLAKFLMYAQERAVVEGRIYRLQIDLEGGRYWLMREVQEEDDVARLHGRYGRIMHLPPGISLGIERDQILFYPDGDADPFFLSLSSPDGKTLLLKNGRPFGHIHVEEIQPAS